MKTSTTPSPVLALVSKKSRPHSFAYSSASSRVTCRLPSLALPPSSPSSSWPSSDAGVAVASSFSSSSAAVSSVADVGVVGSSSDEDARTRSTLFPARAMTMLPGVQDRMVSSRASSRKDTDSYLGLACRCNSLTQVLACSSEAYRIASESVGHVIGSGAGGGRSPTNGFGDIVNYDGRLRVSVVHGRERPESFLSRRVPDFKLDDLVLCKRCTTMSLGCCGRWGRGEREGNAPRRQRWVRNAAPIVGSLLGWKSFWQKRRTTDDLPTADSPVGVEGRGQLSLVLSVASPWPDGELGTIAESVWDR